jgi:hypothetical protein
MGYMWAMARSTSYTPEMGARICSMLMQGISLRKICREDWAPGLSTVTDWLADDVGDFRNRYAHARTIQTEIGADDIQDIADTPEIGVIETDKRDKDGGAYTEVRRADMIEHRKLRIAARQWNAEKLLPKVYGAKQTLVHEGSIDTSDTDAVMERILHILSTGRVKLPGGIEVVRRDTPALPPPDDFSDLA